MNCVLHIGTEKTGSTSLQEFLHLNRVSLRNSGFLYTESAGRRNNWRLPVSVYNPGRRDSFTKKLGIQHDEELLLYQKKVVKGLRSELAKHRGQGTLIFSSEHIQSRLTTEAELGRLKLLLEDLGVTQVQVVVYLRAPEKIASSLYSTAVKHGFTQSCPPSPQDRYWRNICDHRGTITRFRDCFGQEAVVPRIFNSDELVNGSIIDDFAYVAGIPYPRDYYVTPSQQNESVKGLAIEILRRINANMPLFIGGDKVNELRGNIVSYVVSNLDAGEAYGMPEAIVQQYKQAFREGNEWVRVEYFPERQVLFEFSGVPSAPTIKCSSRELDQVAELVSSIWIDKSQELLRIRNSRSYRAMKFVWSLNYKIGMVMSRLKSVFRAA